MIFLKTRGKSCDYEYFSQNVMPPNCNWWKKFKGEFYNPNNSHNIFIEIKENKYEFYIDRLWFLDYKDLSGPDRPIGCVFIGNGDCNDEDSKVLQNLVRYLISSTDYCFIDEKSLLEKEDSLTSEFIQSLDLEDGRRHKAETESEVGRRIKNFSNYLSEFFSEGENCVESTIQSESNDENFSFTFVSVKKANLKYESEFLRALAKKLSSGSGHSFFVFTNLPVYTNELHEFVESNFDDEVFGMIMTSDVETDEVELKLSKTVKEENNARLLAKIKKNVISFFVKIFFFLG
ncbi:MAG: hypothetical protein K6B43_08125 [Treponema sp.]|nr:hypothetical protein [Treponema sp.]